MAPFILIFKFDTYFFFSGVIRAHGLFNTDIQISNLAVDIAPVFTGVLSSVITNDIEESSLSFLSQRCKEAGLKNVKTILGKIDDPLFPKGSLDIAFSTLVYHELKHPITFMKNLRSALKPNALVVIVDYDPKKNKEKSNVGRDWEKEFDEAGFEIVRSEKLHERDVIVILKTKAQ